MELQKMFYSPIAWLILIIFTFQSSMIIMQLAKEMVHLSAMSFSTSNLTYKIFVKGFLSIQSTIFLYIPLLTMGLLSREFSSGSVKLLYSSPISNVQIVLGKFLTMMVFGLVMVFILFLISLCGFVVIKDFDFPVVLTGIFGIFLLICAFSAVGLFMSSLSSYQIVSAIGTFATLFVLQQISNIGQGIDFVRDITYWFCIYGRADTFINGMICSEDVLYFILVPALFITFTVLRLKSIREKSSAFVSIARYTSVFIIISILGYISTIPFLMKYYDSTRTKTNTLTENSQNVISRLKGKVDITTYVNIFDRRNFTYGLPASRKLDIDRFSYYSRFHPDIKFNYKYYYDAPVDINALKVHKAIYAGMTDEDAVNKICEVGDVNPNIFKPGCYYQTIDLRTELNRVVREIRTEDGKTSYLRYYEDAGTFPDESQITAAFKRLVMKSPLVAFVKGHEERSVNDPGFRGYFGLAKNKTFRYSMINNGFDFKECDLSAPVDTTIDILIIADAKIAYTKEEISNLNDYIDRGGNLVIACDIKRQNVMNPLVEHLGVNFLPGQIVEYNNGNSMDLVTSVSTEEGKSLAYQFKTMREDPFNGVFAVTMPGTVAISYNRRDNNFKYIPVLVSDSVKNINQLDTIGSWNELNTIDFIDDVPKYDSNQGEIPGAFVTALAVTRNIGNREQRIMILGDADCFSNGEFNTQRIKIISRNFQMVDGLFYWLSSNELPIDVRRINPPDDTILIEKSGMSLLKNICEIVMPIILLICSLLILLRRKVR